MTDLYKIAEDNGITVAFDDLPCTGSIALPDYICLDQNYLYDSPEERAHLAHELGHCMMGAFYTRSTCLSTRLKMEAKAERWAIKKLVPKDELKTAVLRRQSPYEVADRLGIPLPCLLKAAVLYQLEK